MKSFFVLILSLGICLAAKSQFQNVDSLIKKVFISLKDNNEKSFLEVFPNYQQAQKLAEGIIQHIKDTSIKFQLKEQLKKLNDSTFRSYKADVVRNFQNTIGEGIGKGIDWANTILDSFSYKKDTIPFFEMISVKGVMSLNCKGKVYQLYFSGITWSFSDHAWYGAILKKLAQPGEKISEKDTASYEIKVKDVHISMDKYHPPPPPPPTPKKKASTKSPVGKKEN